MMSMNDPFRGVSAILGARKRRELRGAEHRPGGRLPDEAFASPARPSGVWCVAARAEHDIVSGIAASPAKIGTTSLCLAPSPLSSSLVAWFHVNGNQGAFRQQRRYPCRMVDKSYRRTTRAFQFCLRTHSGRCRLFRISWRGLVGALETPTKARIPIVSIVDK
jgi:hypothetical protein